MNVPLVLSVEPANPTVVAGTETHAFLKLQNDTPLVANLRLIVDEPLAAWIIPNPDSIDVPPNGQATAALVLRPPVEASPEPYLATLHALDRATGSELARLSFALTVAPAAVVPVVVTAAAVLAAAPAPALLLTLNLVRQTSPDSADYVIQLGNPTSTATTAELRALDDTNRLVLVIEPQQVILPAQGQAQSNLRVTASKSLTGDETQRTHTVTVQATSNEGLQPAQASTTFVQTRAEGIASKLPVVLAALAITLVLLALLYLFLNRNQGGTPPQTLSPVPMTLIPTQTPVVTSVPGPTQTAIILTAVPLPTPLPASPVVITAVPLPTPLPPSPIVITSVPPPTATIPPTATTPAFAVTGAVVSVQPGTSDSCPTTFLYTAQVTATGPGSVQFQWVFSNGQSPPPSVMEFGAAGTSIAQTNLVVTESEEGWGQVQFVNPVFEPSNQAPFVLNCAAAPTEQPPATAAP